MYQERLLNAEAGDVEWNPVDPEEDAVDPNDEPIAEPPELNTGQGSGGISQQVEPGFIGPTGLPEPPKSLNEELEEKIKNDPNRFLGCGG